MILSLLKLYHSSKNMKWNIFDLIVWLSGIVILIEGFDSEFYNPTVFDWIKWIAYIILLTVYIIYRKADNHGIRSKEKS